ncbi:MAG: hypothetical protein M3457_02715 [Chloroflexota bacterium]|nr:hypothetical protein [Chloroflexota bacterium]
MAKDILHCIADRGEVVAFLAALPEDPERDRLAAEYRRLSAAYEQVGRRANALAPRLDASVDDLIDATGKRREALLAEYVSLSTELDALPRLRSAMARKFAHALNAWVRHVRPQVVQEHDRRAADAVQLTRDLAPYGALVERFDQSPTLRAVNQQQYDEAWRELARLRPCVARQQEARQVVDLIDMTTTKYFGSATPPNGATIDRFVSATARPAA